MIICKGSSIDGLDSDFDVIHWCGYQKISEEERDKILDESFDINFFLDNPYVDYDSKEVEDTMPGMSDIYYTFRTYDEKELNKAKEFVREEIDKILSK